MAGEMWFAGFEPNGGNNWATGDDDSGGEQPIRVYASPLQIEPGGETRLVVESDDLGLVGKTVVLTVSDASKAAPVSLTGVMERNAYGTVSCSFRVEGIAVGTSTISAVVNG